MGPQHRSPGRCGCCHPHPPQIRTCRITASGSSRGSFAPSAPPRLSIAVSWTGSQGPVSPPVFPVNGSPLATPPFPRPGLDGLDSPASAVLRRRYDSPLRMPGHSWCSRPGSTPISSFVLAEALPPGWRKPRGPGQFGHSAVPSAGLLRRVGEYGVSQVPWRSFPCLCQAPGPRSDPRWQAIEPGRCCPRSEENEGSGVQSDFGACHLASALAVYASRALSPGPCKTRFRLAG